MDWLIRFSAGDNYCSGLRDPAQQLATQSTVSPALTLVKSAGGCHQPRPTGHPPPIFAGNGVVACDKWRSVGYPPMMCPVPPFAPAASTGTFLEAGSHEAWLCTPMIVQPTISSNLALRVLSPSSCTAAVPFPFAVLRSPVSARHLVG